ncbi:MAG: HAD family hydrolase [Candidatus Hodarchaeales archaeon]
MDDNNSVRKRTRGLIGKKTMCIFDLDDTLYDYEQAHAAGMQSAYSCWKNSGHNHTFHEFETEYKEARIWIKRFLNDTASSHSRVLYFQRLVESILKRPKASLIIKLVDSYYDGFYKSMKLFDGVLSVLNTLKKQGFKIGLVTNMQAVVQYRKLLLLGLGDYFDTIVTSEAVNHEKPNPHIFLYALNMMKGEPRQTFMIGDSFKNDIEPALWLGMTAIWFNHRNRDIDGTGGVEFHQIKKFNDILSIIEK